ncbi:alpha/beta hydrolase [Filimonas effusa]|uniref:Alpha/beta hydrolase n=1 Tax=Filimonas effusa TaxID=2508721 RepID=A0A4Q1D809_9BACT|nr:alpha/beta hydrolase [Filimonas effusa]RXK85320.1 alpha/beta hydrolase [Filimonas effusa]
MKQKVYFNSNGCVLVGNVYMPPDFNPEKNYPAILVGGSWTTVKEQMSGLYAAELAKQGFITLAIDPRFFGESQGKPRFWENPQAKIEDYKNAVSFLYNFQNVDNDNIFLVSICASSGYMATVTAGDKRVKGLAAVAAWLHDNEAVKMIYGGEQGVRQKIYQARKAKELFEETNETTFIPAISTTDENAAMFGEYDYYLDPNRGAVPQWSADKFAVMSWEDWLTFNPMPVAAHITTPVLMIHSDQAVLPDYTKKFFNTIPHQHKVLHWTNGSQFDFYDNPIQVAEAVATINTFFKTNRN